MKTFQETVRHVCKYAEMYVGERRLVTVAAWLNGYTEALLQNENSTDRASMSGFREWLSSRLYASHGMAPNFAWEAYIERLYSDDEEALKQLPLLIDEFCQSTGRD